MKLWSSGDDTMILVLTAFGVVPVPVGRTRVFPVCCSSNTADHPALHESLHYENSSTPGRVEGPVTQCPSVSLFWIDRYVPICSTIIGGNQHVA